MTLLPLHRDDEELDELKTYSGYWRILCLTTKGQFVHPRTFPTKHDAQNEIERLKVYHKTQSKGLFQWDGQFDISAIAYFAIPVGDQT